MQDVGKSKAVIAAERINSRVAGVTVTPHHARIEDMPLEFYQDFTVIILGLDSLEARRYMNSIACSLLGRASALFRSWYGVLRARVWVVGTGHVAPLAEDM